MKGNNALAAITQANHTPVNQLLDHIEAVLISSVEPPHNRQGGRFGPDVEQYLQVRDEKNLGPTPEKMVKELYLQRQFG